ncbi:class I SAM-dependent methyltransferase [Metabacillus herbersteinensis]|uniref:Class I SAM-dependent methyltransferase n=1 Tax=Metabacillus herbersteinensis TaxID=283816 RepID=A0ABV6GED0_9BACI
MLIHLCKELEKDPPISSYKIFEEFEMLSGHPWEKLSQSAITNYYSCLYGITEKLKPLRILEIGTAFGMSAASFLKATIKLDLFVTLDLGIYGDQLGSSKNNIEYAKKQIHSWCKKNDISCSKVRFFKANTQPNSNGDNENNGLNVPKWHEIPELVMLLQQENFDLVFVDGKHTEEGLLNDLKTFWRFLKPGGVILCDDLHDPNEFNGHFSWCPDTWKSYHQFLNSEFKNEIGEYFIWNFPRVPPKGKNGLRPLGLIRKKCNNVKTNPNFSVFYEPNAKMINKARLVHLASLGLDLANSKVLEVGTGVGEHTAFFEKLNCDVLSTDAREENVKEHLSRYPSRAVKIADLIVPGSHEKFGKFDIVYCYGTLYHLNDPSLCIKELSKVCEKYFLIETCVNFVDNEKINIVEENKDYLNQSYHGKGCRPGRDWIMNELKKFFPYVYLTKSQPNHPEFPEEWPVVNCERLSRSVFVASKIPLNKSSLSSELLYKQKRLDF